MEGNNNEKLLEVDEENVSKEETLKSKIWTETKKMWVIAGPGILIRFSTFGVNVISQAFIGHIGATELAAYALIFTVLFRFVLGILLGMTSGFGTLCGQAYGAKQYHKLGVYLQQSWIVLFTVSALLSPPFIFAAPILKALGQDERIADMAGAIALWFIPIVFSYAVLASCNIYLQSQSKNFILSCFAVVSLLLHIFLSWLLTVKYEFGVPGAMVSTLVAYWAPNAGQLLYIMFGGCRETWRGFSWLAFRDLGPAIKLSLSSGVMVCVETWYNTILILLTGNMENAEVTIDALSICLNISGWALMVSLGFMGTARENVAYIFTKSQDVARAVARLSPLLAFTILLNGIQPVLSGVANGSGQQGTVAYVNLGSYYLIGIPLGVLLGFFIKLQVEGLWMGMIIGTAVQTAILVIMTWRTDWDNQVYLAQKRVNRQFLEAETSNNSSLNNSGAA